MRTLSENACFYLICSLKVILWCICVATSCISTAVVSALSAVGTAAGALEVTFLHVTYILLHRTQPVIES